MAKIANEDIPEFEILFYEQVSEALEDLKIGKLTGFVVIPQGFGAAIEKYQLGEISEIPLELTYDETDPMSAPRIIPIIRTAALQFLGIKIPLNLRVKGTQPEIKEFINFFVPGLIIFGLMILAPITGRRMLSDKEKGFLPRLFTTPIKSAEFILGYSLPYILIVIIQIIIYINVGLLIGLKIIGSIWLAFLIFFIIGLCSIGIAMIVATLAKSEAQGETISWLLLIPLAMLSGLWFSTEEMHPVMKSIAQVLPFSHAADASRHIITTGASFKAVSHDFLFVVGWALILFAVGIVLFKRSMAR
jgi:ABC-2 type transport system permease protein